MVAGAFGGGWIVNEWLGKEGSNPKVNEPKEGVLLTFTGEIYELIQSNYWEKISDDDLSNIYQKAIEKVVGQPQTLTDHNVAGVKNMLDDVLKTIDESKKKEMVASVNDMVLVNLKPFSRSRLYSLKEEKTLSNVVNNVNPGTNHFEELGVPVTATDKQVAEAFDNKTKELEPKAKESTEAAIKLAEINQAYKVLKNSDDRKIYQTSGVEPTIDYRLMSPEIFYVHLNKFSPTSVEEFVRITAKVDQGEKLDTLIFDLRDNVGGAIDSLPVFLGPFIGPDQYAYQFFHQGVKEDYRTTVGWLNSLVRYKKVIILINENSQSSAEVMAATLKKYNVGVVVGTTTRGWGTVEKVFPLQTQIDPTEKFSVFLVHRLTLRDDGQPIEGKGVEPMISIKNTNWKKELMQRFNDENIVRAVEEIYVGN